MAWPGFPGWGGMGGMNAWGGGGRMPGFGYPGGGGMGGGINLGPRDPCLEPHLQCTGATGMPMNLIIDTGASISVMGYAAFMRHYCDRVGVDTNKNVGLGVIGSAEMRTVGRFTMTLNLRTDDGGNVKVSGDCFIIPNNPSFCDVLLGMPYLIQNRMNLRWDPDYVDVQGKKVPILMTAS